MNFNIYDILILIVLAGVLFAIIRSMVKSKKQGGGCSGCKGCPSYKSGK